MRRPLAALAISACLLDLSACDTTEPAHTVEVLRDTLVLYGADDTPIPVRITAADGREILAQDAEVDIADTTALRRRFGWVACAGQEPEAGSPARAGQSAVTVTSNQGSGRFIAICRPAQRIDGTHFIDLALGDSGVALAFTAHLDAGGTEPVRLAFAEASDSTIARVADGRVHAVAVGRTTVAVNHGGARRPVHVRVSETIARDTLALVPGEFRSWKLEPGRYEITVRGSAKAGEFTGLEMTGEGLKCAPDPRDDGVIHCIVYERAGIGLRNERSDGTTRHAAVTIIRVP